MKSRFAKIGLCIVILVSLLAVSFALIRPVYIGLGNYMRSKLAILNSSLNEKCGLNVSYSSLSPSILTGIKLKGIVVSDTSSGQDVLSIKKATVDFSIRNLIKGDFENALSKIVINDVNGKIVKEKNSAWIDYLIAQNLEKKKNEESEKKSIVEMLADSDINFELPCNININNLTLTFVDEQSKIDTTIFLRRILAEKTLTQGKYNIQLLGQVFGAIEKNEFSSNLYVQSSLLQKLNNSSAVIQLFNSSFNNYNFGQFGFLGEYNDAVFNFRMLPTIQNLYVELKTNFKTQESDLNLFSDNFRVSQLVRSFKSGTSLASLSGILLTSRLSVHYDWGAQKINYNASGNAILPESLIDGGLSVNYAFNGNQNYVQVSYLNALSEKIDLGFSGGVNIKALQPEGVLSINKFQLENERSIQAEIFLEPLSKGFMAFSPEIMFEDKTFTAAMFNLIPQPEGFDFDFEVYDYSHAETGETGHLTLDGNYLTASKFLQSNLNIDGMYIDSLLQTAAFFMGKNQSSFVNDASSIFKHTIFSTSVYISAEGTDYSFSIPSAIIADTVSDNKMLMVALDGNKDNIQLTRFELILDDKNIVATAHAENLIEPISKQPQTILAGMVEYNSIPYNFSGLISKDWINITGDYGLNFTFMNDLESDNLLGNFALMEFPIKLSDSSLLSFTADTNFSYNRDEKINASINKFQIESLDGISQINPVFDFVGNVDKSGVYLENISYNDLVSELAGSGFVIWDYYDSNFVNLVYDISLQDTLYNERVSLKGNITNPENKPFSTETFLKDYYISFEAELVSFRTGRFTGSTNTSDTMNANISVTGNLSNPFVSISVPRGMFTIENRPVNFSLQASVVDLELEVTSAEFQVEYTIINNVFAKFSFADWIGSLSFNFSTVVLDKTLIAPIQCSVKGIIPEENKDAVPDSFEVDIKTEKLSGTFIKSQQPISVHILKLPEETFITSSENLGLSATILSTGELTGSVINGIPFNLKLEGNLKRNIGIHFYDIDADVVRFTKLIDFDIIKFYSGKVVGDFWIRGTNKNRSFDGMVMLIPGELSMPDYFKTRAKTDIVYFSFEKNRIFTPKTRFYLKKSPVDITLSFLFNDLKFDSFNVLVETIGDAYIPININIPQVHIKGNAQADLEISVEEKSATVLGSIVVKDTTAEFGNSTITDVVTTVNQSINEDSKIYEKQFDVEVMLDVTMQSRVQVFYSTFIRGLVVPNSRVTFAYNSAQENMAIDGSVPLRSGEIIYLNSSFYIKEGRIDFSDTDIGFDPYVTIRAETRERDSQNNDVTISLSIDHQRISELTPKLTSSPAKSEKDIMELLGNFVTARSENVTSFMLATGDYALQTLLIRKVENALRDFLNFDILSIRTMVVQNALKYSMAQSSEQQGITISNFLDNTTVYIGKYFGNALYADAMLRLVYNKNRISDGSTLQGLILQPEIGFEMESPLAKIRWSLAPDLSDLSRNNFVIIPSLTLSWKFDF